MGLVSFPLLSVLTMSFRPRARPSSAAAAIGATLPSGTALSPLTGTPITSWGHRALDGALAGGLPLGTLTLVQQDSPTAYHEALLSYVTAEGLANDHLILFISLCSPPHTILARLPANVTSASSPISRGGAITSTSGVTKSNAPDLQIAWRYAASSPTGMAAARGGVTSRLTAHDFDLSQAASVPSIRSLVPIGPDPASTTPLQSILQALGTHLSSAHGRVVRVVIHGLSTARFTPPNDLSISAFLTRVRALMRQCGGVAVVSCTNDVMFADIHAAVDAVVSIDSFNGAGAVVAGLGREWHGVLVVRKMFREGRAKAIPGKGDVWVFRRSRRRFVIERATAAPDDLAEDTTPEDGGGIKSAAAVPICAPGPGGNDLDF